MKAIQALIFFQKPCVHLNVNLNICFTMNAIQHDVHQYLFIFFTQLSFPHLSIIFILYNQIRTEMVQLNIK